jgi:hypothetical protein
LKKKDPEHIGTILKQLFSEQEWEEQLKASLTLLQWQEVVGTQIARQSQPEYLKDGILHVRVENSVWLNHLRFLGEELRHKLNKKLSSSSVEISEIRFRQGPLDPVTTPPVSTEPKAPTITRAPSEPPPPLDPEQQRLLETIPDSDLRKALEMLLRRQRDHSRT